MNNASFGLNDIVEMKKQHPCGTNRWQVIRLGADIKIKCCHCERVLMMPRPDFKKTWYSVSRNELTAALPQTGGV